MRSTIKDVAKRAGVSIATVSRVLNSSNVVNEETRLLVENAVRELRYSPNIAARNLSRSRTETIGILLPDLYGEFFSEVLRGMDRTARKQNYHLFISSSHNNKVEIEAALRVMSGRVDGLIIMSPHIDATSLNANLPSALPLVLLNCHVEGDEFDAINIDNYRGAFEVVKHLAVHGHKRIAIIKGTEKNIDAQERLRGYRDALEEAGAEYSKAFEIPGDFTEQSSYKAALQILQMKPRPTAIFASNDAMAIAALSALRTQRVSVPEEIALVGFDDIPISSYIKPSLTTVRVGISDLGALAVERLLNAIQKKKEHTKRHMVMRTELVVRESCGCASPTELIT
jgi:LacI family transcriptional regulator